MSNKFKDLRLLAHNILIHITLILYVTGSCLLAIFSWTHLAGPWPLEMKLVTLAFLASITYGLFGPLHNLISRITEYFFCTHNYVQCKALVRIADQINNIIDLEKLSGLILSRVIGAMESQKACLIVAEDCDFQSGFTVYPGPNCQGASVILRPDSPLLEWLAQNGPISTGNIVDFKAGTEEEKRILETARVSLLFPIKNERKLVAILALGETPTGRSYTPADIAVLESFSGSAAPVIENALLYQKARQRASTDELTGLFNQGYFHQRMEEEISRSIRFGEIFSLIFLDVDDFKRHNDVNGHLAGDQILKNIGAFIKANTRGSDLCFRYGGDEFAIILPKTSLEGSRVVAERILAGISSQGFFSEIPLTFSLGIASWPTDGVVKDDLVRSADAALYHSKHTGKDRISLSCEVALSEVFRIESLINQKTQDSSALLKTIFTLASTVDAKDYCTANHSQNVTRYATEIATALGFSDQGVDRVRVAALLHDVGKIGIPDQVLKKIGPLTADEREIMHAHPNLSVSIIQHVDSLRESLAGIQYHHENFNGTGYPSGLKENNIPLDARILGVADAFDAMTSPRLYRRTFSYEEALAELKNCSGTQFDPEIVEVFLRIKDKMGFSSAALDNESVAK
jgi:diguanylate cyclase (GGDEF)-like protein/putative nucleotidyltransferase with HDIG domain